jgi:hypothetical protein
MTVLSRPVVDVDLEPSAVAEARGRAIAKLLGALPPHGHQVTVPLERRRLVPDRTPHYLGELIDAAVRENA